MFKQAGLPQMVFRQARIGAPRVALVTALLLGSGCALYGQAGNSRLDAQSALRQAPVWIEDAGKSAAAANDGGIPADTVTVQAGDRLSSIAERLSGSADDWRVLAEFNELSDPDAIEVGDVLRLPPGMQLDEQQRAASAERSGRLSLLSALRSAQSNDSALRIARAAYDIARQDLPIAQSALKPQAGALLSAGYTDLFDDRIDPYTDQQIGINLSQSLFNSAASKAVAQAERSGSIARTELLLSQEDLVLRVSEAFFNILGNSAELQFRESDLGAISRQLQQTRRRFDVGEIAATDVAEAQARYDLAVAAEIQARNTLENSREVLAEITSHSTADTLMTLREDIPLTPPTPADIDYWLDSANNNNTGVILARSRHEMAEKQIDVVRAGRLPTVDLGAALGSSDSGNDMIQDGERANVELALQLPILTGGLISARLAQEKLRAHQAAEQVAAAERSAQRTTRAAFRDVQANISRVNALSQALVSTRLAASATRAGFDAGTRTSVELLTAQRDTFRAQAEYARARFGYLLSVLRLKRSAGVLEASDIVAINHLLI